MKLFDPALRFYKGNTHTHTTLSDGRVSPEECMRQYKAAGYDFLALTDHWHVGEERSYQGMLIVPGVEYDFTFPTQVLHLVCLYPDARLAAGIDRGTDHKAVIDHINRVGGVAIAAHPAWSLNTPDFLASLDGVRLSEVYNTMSGEPYNGPRANSESLLDVAAANGKLFSLVAADDSHAYQGEQCVSYIMLQAEELTVPSVLQALRQGRFYASQGPQFHNIEFRGDELVIESSPVRRITVCSNLYYVKDRCAEGQDLTGRKYQVRPGERWLRVQMIDDQGRTAWSSPIDLTKRKDHP